MKKNSQRLRKLHENATNTLHNYKEQLLLSSLIDFYQKNPDHLEILKGFLKNKQRRLSLRLLDWLVTNYSKKYNIVISNDNNVDFLYLAYKNHLKSFSKKFFDAFARRQRIFYSFENKVHKIAFDEIDSYINREDGVITTVAQLNAFRFFITCGVIKYAVDHLEQIEQDMVKGITNSKENAFLCCKIDMIIKFN
jgi:hypothetical protein